MAVTPANWSIVILGNWNTAILTPSGIARRLFKLDDGTPVEVHVALDTIGPLRVIHNNIVVMPSRNSLVVETVIKGQDLDRALEVACNALEDLPETPVSAAGINIRYAVTDPGTEFLELLGEKIDRVLGDISAVPSKRSISRTIEYKEGVINIKASQSEDSDYAVEFNFHKDSNSQGELLGWLKMNHEEIQTRTKELTKKIFKLDFEEE